MPATYLEIGNRFEGVDRVHYADVDLAVIADANGREIYAKKNGTPY